MRKKLLEGLFVGTGVTCLVLLLWLTGALDRWEFATWSWRVEFFARPEKASDKIKIILLDQDSLDWGKDENGWSWPWPREVYSPLIDFCKRSGARAVIFDVLYTEPSVYGVSDDRALGAAISGAPSFIGALSLSRQTGAEAWPSAVPGRSMLVFDHLEQWLTTAAAESIVMPKAGFPVPEVATNAAMLANVLDEPDMDGIFRRAGLFKVFDGRAVASPGLAAFLARSGSPSTELGKIGIRTGKLLLGDKNIPIDNNGKAILRYRGPSGTYETYSAASVIQSELRLEAGEMPTIGNVDVFKDCYVFFGFSAPGLLDLRPTPISRVFPGVEIHATVLDNLLSGDFLQETPRMATITTTFFLAVLSAVVMVLSRKVLHSVMAFGLLLPVPVLAGFAGYRLGLWWPLVVQEAAVGISLVGGIVLNYATEGRQRAFIKKAFKHYLSPAVIEQILLNPSQLQLGGERRELTILFSDLQGFSSISERLDPQALTTLLNDYLSDMTDIILEEGGTLDKYEGDAIIAFWNAPTHQPDHAKRACRAAIRCQRKLQERREEFKQRTGEELHARIGINTGEVVVGNMGSRNRFDYTVLGDAANLASRLEGANKFFGTFTMVSESTWSQTHGEFVGREIGLLRVVGRKTPVRVYEPVAFSQESDTVAFPLDEFHHALSLSYSGERDKAMELFRSFQNDSVAKVYAEQCGVVSWDGIWNLTSK